MDYEKIYNNIIEKAKQECRLKGGDVYYERHHIKPKCLGGDNSKHNIVLLTAREHFVCHKILFHANPNNKKLATSFYFMVYSNNNTNHINKTSRDFELARIAAKIASTGNNNPMFGKKHKEETKRKISEKAVGVVRTKGIKMSIETKLKISKANKGRLLGIKKSKEMREKLSKTNLGRKAAFMCHNVKKRKPFSAESPNGNIYKFHSAKDMNAFFEVSLCGTSSCLKKRQKSVGGWSKFEYINA